MISALKKSYALMGTTVNSSYANIILGTLFYLEAIFFLPTDPILIVYCIERRDRAYWFAFIATVASVVGGLCSYMIGYWLWQHCGPTITHHTILNYFISSKTLLNAMALYREYAWAAILIAGFTPVPFKAATLTAGFCNISLLPFILSSIIVRGIRYYLCAFTICLFGHQFGTSMNRYYNLLLASVIIIIGIGYVYIRYR